MTDRAAFSLSCREIERDVRQLMAHGLSQEEILGHYESIADLPAFRDFVARIFRESSLLDGKAKSVYFPPTSSF